MPDYTSVQISPKTRDELRIVKAQAAVAAGMTVDYDTIVRALVNHWRKDPPADVALVLADQEAGHGC